MNDGDIEHLEPATLDGREQAAGDGGLAGEAVLELNVAHPLVRYLEGLPAGEDFDGLARLLHEQARLAESGQLDRPAEFNRTLNQVLARLAGVR